MQKERKNSQARQKNNDLVIKQSQGLKKKVKFLKGYS